MKQVIGSNEVSSKQNISVICFKRIVTSFKSIFDTLSNSLNELPERISTIKFTM